MGSPDLNEQRMQRYWSRIQRALQVLQKAKRHSLDPHGDFYQGESMQSNDIGDWVEFDDVAKAIQILEGRQ